MPEPASTADSDTSPPRQAELQAEPPRPPPGARESWAALTERLARAREGRRADGTERFFTFGGRVARVLVIGRCLSRRILRPFAHLELEDRPADPPALAVDMWDEAECPTEGGDPFGGLEVEDTLPVQASEDGRFVSYLSAQSWTAIDRQERRIISMVADTERLTLYERGRPLHAPLLLWHRDQGLEALHAGLVARSDQGVLFVGEGGSGKSTAALSCLFAGFDYLGDDYIGLQSLSDGSRVGHSLYCSTHLEPAQLERFPELAARAAPATLAREDKWLVLLDDVCPDRLGRAASITRIVLPIVTGVRRPRLRPASKGEALLRLAPTSLLMLPHARHNAMDALAGLVDGASCHWLELGGMPERIPELIGGLLEGKA